jgi:hypothetical protein
MKNNEEDIENLFGNRFSDDEAPVSPRVWDNIKKTLPKDNDPGTGYFGKIIRFGLPVILISILGALFFINSSDKNISPNEQGNNIENKENNNSKNSGLKNTTTSNLVIENTTAADKLEVNKDKGNEGKNKIKNNRSKNLNNSNGSSLTLINTKSNRSDTNTKGNKKGKKETKVNNNNTFNAQPSNQLVLNNSSSDDQSNNQTITNSETTNNQSPNQSVINKEIANLKVMDNGSINNSVVTNEQPDLAINNTIIDYNNKASKEEPKEEDKTGKTNDNFSNDQNSNLPITNNTSINSDSKNQPSSSNDSTSQLITNNEPINLATADSVKMDTTSVPSKDTTGVDKENQEKQNKKDLLPRWSFDVLLSPVLSGATSKADSSYYKPVVDSKNKQDRNHLNFSAGGMLNYSVFPRFNLSVGVIYSGYSEKYNFKNSKISDTIYLQKYHQIDSVFVQDTAGNSTLFIYDSVKTKKVPGKVTKNYSSSKLDKYSFLSFPINISYNLLNRGKISLSTTAGVKINMLLNGVTYVRNPENTGLVEVTKSISKVTLSYMAAFGMEYRWKEKVSLIAQPVVNFNLSSVYKSSYLSQKPYSFGMSVGLRFRL